MQTPKHSRSSPIAVLGAGDLVSHLRRIDSEESSDYRFNVFRQSPSGRVSQSLRIGHLSDLLNLCHVLAFAILDDGWASEQRRDELQVLIEKLESIRDLEVT